jgi:hypothetical protein
LEVRPDRREDDPSDGHIPGSGIDFSVIGGLRTVPPDAVRGTGIPSPVRRTHAVSPPERLLRIDGRFQIGQIVVAVDAERGVGRPMQVRHAARTWAAVLDDPSLGQLPDARAEEAALLLEHAWQPATVWRLLELWQVHRCPRCQGPGLTIARGLPDGPPGPGVALGGCAILPFDADVACSKCGARWILPPELIDAD